MNPDRKEIYQKTDGHCYYCGRTLDGKWHVDHVEAVYRKPDGSHSKPELDKNDNKVPSCPRCNRWKTVYDIEGFRSAIQNLVTVLNRDSPQYRMAKDYGLIKETEKEVVFRFEDKEAGYCSVLSDEEKMFLKRMMNYISNFSSISRDHRIIKSIINKLRL